MFMRKLKICEYCKIEFRSKNGQGQKYCSQKCYQANRPPTMVNCEICRKSFQVMPYMIRGGFGRFCSLVCRDIWQSDKIEKTCLRCDKKFSISKCLEKIGKGKYCSRTCKDQAAREDIRSPIARFIDKIIILPGPDACWIWTGSKTSVKLKNIYGTFKATEKVILAHRFSYEYFREPLGDNFGCHRCNISLCVSPSHVYSGDAGTNTSDMLMSGRSCAIFTPEQVRYVRSSDLTSTALAKMLNASKTTIKSIRRRKTYKHILPV